MLRFWGASDDLVEIDGDLIGEISTYKNYGVVAKIGTDDAGCYVRIAYSTLENNGSWNITIGRIDEDVPIPWAIQIIHGDRAGNNGESGYTTVAEIDCPPGTRVIWRSGPDENWSFPS